MDAYSWQINKWCWPPKFDIYINASSKPREQINCIGNVLLLIFDIACVFVLQDNKKNCQINLHHKRMKSTMITNPTLTFTLLFESINRSATNESNFSCETSTISGLKLNWFLSRRTLPAVTQYIITVNFTAINYIG